jgi:hypothetical protein
VSTAVRHLVSLVRWGRKTPAEATELGRSTLSSRDLRDLSRVLSTLR